MHQLSCSLLALLLLLCLVPVAAAVTVEPPLQAGDAEIPWQWIGLQIDVHTPCPQPEGGNWTTDYLFAPAIAGGVDGIPPALRSFCLYSQPAPGSVSAAALGALAALKPAKLSALEMDSLSVTPSGVIENALWRDLENHFLQQAGHAIRLDRKGSTTHLAILDTTRTDNKRAHHHEGNSPHGYTLLNMAHTLLCQGRRCAADITSRLAMPFRIESRGTSHRVVRDTRHGGQFGSIAELARGLQREVALWTSRRNTSRLVLNLSLGWDPVFGGGATDVSTMPLAVQAAYRAIADARCRGALVIAAAGNDPGGPALTGPLFPAAWEHRAVPGTAACTQAIGYTPPDGPPPGGGPIYNPLVYAVSGVQADGTRLANQRSGAGASLAAFADHGVVKGHTAGSPTAVLTGSSVATLVVSSAAALVWHHLPALRGDEVMAHVYQSGDDLRRPPEVVLPTAGRLRPSVRRASLCAAQQRACRTDGPCRVPLRPCPPWNPARLDLSSAFSSIASAVTDEVDLTLKTNEKILPRECRSRALRVEKDRAHPANPCPDRQYRQSAAAPWRTDPQPGSSFCPSCPLNESTSTLLLETDGSDPRAVWSDPILVLCGVSYDLGISELTAGQVFAVTGISLGSCREAWLSALTTDGSVTSPLLIGGS